MDTIPSTQPIWQTIRWRWLLFTLIIASIIVWLTMRPGQPRNMSSLNLNLLSLHGPALLCFVNNCPNFKSIFWLVMIGVVGNIVVFVPFGLGLTATFQYYFKYKVTAPLIVFSGFLLSLAIELKQLSIPWRSTDVDDLLFNTVGTLIGLALWFIVGRRK